MTTQDQQTFIGKYKIISQYSYGSTSIVYKVCESQKQPCTEKQKNKITSHIKQIMLQKQIAQSNFQKKQVSSTKQQQKRHFLNKPEIQKKELIFKQYCLQKMTNKDGRILDFIKYDLLAEIIIFMFIKHPGLLNAHSFLVQYDQIKTQLKTTYKLKTFGIIMQFCQKGSFSTLIDYINRTQSLRENKVKIFKFYISQISNILQYLNKQKKILHRDIKIQNLMIMSGKDLKIIDYGTCKIPYYLLQKFDKDQRKSQILKIFDLNPQLSLIELYNLFRSHQQQRRNLIGSKHYISPQLVQKYQADMQLIEEAYQKTDIWSLGILIYRIFHDKFPFEGRNVKQTLQMIYQPGCHYKIDQTLNQQIKQLIKNCLIKDYSKRLSWKQIGQLPFFKQYPIKQIWQYESPIKYLIFKHRQCNKNRFQNIQDRIYQKQILTVQKDGKNKIRHLLFAKQQKKPFPILLALKPKGSVAFQIQMNKQNVNNIKLQIKQNLLYIQFKNKKQEKNQDTIIIKSDKEILDQLVSLVIEHMKINKQQREKQSQQLKQI